MNTTLVIENSNIEIESSGATPMMQQYLSIKSEYKDCLLFYRMGDFYEMFFDDAIQAAKILDIALTKRGKHENQDIAMCGVPYHSSDAYLHKLINNGYKVAICEQIESPEEAKKRGYKSIVRREVVRVMTPGTITEDNLLDARSSNYLVSIAKINNDVSIAWVDISTGEFNVTNSSVINLSIDLARLSPQEILVSDKTYDSEDFSKSISDWITKVTIQVNSLYDICRCEGKIKSFFGIGAIDGIAKFSKAQISACGVIIEYILLTQKNSMPKLQFPRIQKKENFMSIDLATRHNLELVRNLDGSKKNTLLNVIDDTITSTGARLLTRYLSAPLLDCHVINTRLNQVDFFYENDDLRLKLRNVLKNIPDIERSLSRLTLKRGGPRDLLFIRNALSECLILAEYIEYSNIELTLQLKTILTYLGGFDELITNLVEALREEVPLLARDGGFIKEGFSARLDDLHNIGTTSIVKLNELKQIYIAKTGIQNLKITNNNVLGYYIEISPQQSSKINYPEFIHRQTLTSSVRYTTIELKQLESNIVNARDNIIRLELDIFEELSNNILQYSDKIIFAAQSIAFIDVFTSLAEIAKKNLYTRPIVDNSTDFFIEQGRHPIVERSFTENFIANDCLLNEEEKIWLLTGPNMAGKSTFLRQNALIAILAQIGSFVPAKSARIGIIDRIFSRVGAADDLASGRSTFMVEMIETATILNQATNKSFIILDEIGRGTSTYDGLAIAWSCLEYLHNQIDSRAIFATHYHELTKLTNDLPHLKSYTMSIKEWNNKIIFMHKIIKGCADKSYGIYVAELAGIPEKVIMRAKEILENLESDTR